MVTGSGVNLFLSEDGVPLMLTAITRKVSPNIGQCEIKHIPRQEIDLNLARHQHANYERALTELGCHVITLPEELLLPDSVFVEDVAIVLDEIAIITRPGAESRREEASSISEVLGKYRTISAIKSPGTLEGGDVLKVGKALYTGLSDRTNEAGIQQLAEKVAPYGYEVVPVRVDGCLHLKSAVTHVGGDMLLVNRSWIDVESFPGKTFIDVDPEEPYAANALLVGDKIIYPVNFPKTLIRLEDAGYSALVVNVSELQKAEGAVTCCSLIFR
jgi:dimethylargininase